MTNPKCKTCNGTKISCGDKGLIDCPDCTKPKCAECEGSKVLLGKSEYGNLAIWDCLSCGAPELSKAQQCKAKLDAVLQECKGNFALAHGCRDVYLEVDGEKLLLLGDGIAYVYNGKTEVSDDRF